MFSYLKKKKGKCCI